MLVASLTTVSCSDYFDPSPKDVMDTKEYIGEESQVFKGMLGIYSRMQEAGDQAIFLTDTRMSILETTSNAPDALQSIYNYDDTDNNEYADPTCYYRIIIACNDYIKKMDAFIASHGGASDVLTDSKDIDQYKKNLTMSEATANALQPLLSSALRIKVWAYYMLGRNYGEAYWFDDALEEMKSLDDVKVFTYCDMQQLTQKCLQLLDNGINVQGFHVSADLIMNWYTWLNTQTTDQDTYRQWSYITPPYLLLKAELLSWKCNYETEDAAKADWQWIRDNLISYMNKIHKATLPAELTQFGLGGFDVNDDGNLQSMGHVYMTNIPLQSDATSAYYNIFFTESFGSKYQVVSTILYNYANYQRNRLVQYFCPEYPGDGFYLRPAEYATAIKMSADDQNALYQEGDIRSITQKMVMNNLGGEQCITKYYYTYVASQRTYKYLRDKIYEIQPSIPLFRGHDYHFLLAEAENHLGNWDQAQAILNGGVTERFASRALPTDTIFDANSNPVIDQYGQYQVKDEHGCVWNTGYDSWFGSAGGYGDNGIAGVANGTRYAEVTSNGDGTYQLNGATITEQERRAYIDWCLAQEHAKEYVAEGKSYGYLCKMAERWSNGGRGDKATAANKMADIITPKYKAVGKEAKVRASLQQKYFINWNLKK